MGEVFDEELRDLFHNSFASAYRLEGIRDTDSLYLGVIGLSRTSPEFRCVDGFPFTSGLTPTSRFMMRTITANNGKLVVFVIFRRFDSSELSGVPDDIIAGWVPIYEEGKARQWVAQMNEEVRISRETLPLDPLREGIDLTFEFRTEFSGPVEDIIEIVHPRIHCLFAPAVNSPYGERLTYQEVSHAQRVWLVECLPVATYPRRFAFVSAGKAALLPTYTTAEELPADTLDKLENGWMGDEGNGGLNWYVPSADELRIDPLRPTDKTGTNV